MHPVGINDFGYTPILKVSPAEMDALEELPPHIKAKMLPFVILQPWRGAHKLDSAIARIDAALGNNPAILDITDKTFPPDSTRPVHSQITDLRDSTNGYNNWCAFIEAHANYIPCLQLADYAEIIPQIDRMQEMGRGIVIRLIEEQFPSADVISKLLSTYDSNQFVYFILDYRKKNRDILTKVAEAHAIATSIRKNVPDCILSFSASTFPSSFDGLDSQEIFERRFHDLLVAHFGDDNIIYCDRGSARAQDMGGGGKSPARIDNPSATKWYFFRESDDNEEKTANYQNAALRALTSDEWIDLGVWGSELIKKTSVLHADGIYSPAKSTAARINMHMFVQLNAGSGPSETEWKD